jgi:ABC-type multidrug transport system fused ATPase/permease subunit
MFLKDLSKAFLQNISFSVEKNELLGIIGTVGSGKTTLLLALLHEISDMKGEVNINGSIFYVPQEPWIYSATIRENIIFGKEYNSEKLAKVIEVCALSEVINIEARKQFLFMPSIF